MTLSRLLAGLLGTALILWVGIACAEPVSWSAPMDQYPTQWSPTTEPAAQQSNAYQQQYPQPGYWFGAGYPQAPYASNATAQASYANYRQYLQSGGQYGPTPPPGNPYYGNYGQ